MNENWDELLAEWGDSLTLFARQFVPSHTDAEEAVQNGFIRFWNIREQAKDAKALMFTCVKRAALDVARGEGRRRRHETAAAAEAAESNACFMVDIEHRERQIEIETALMALPVNQREVLVMKIWGQATFAQIAAALELSANTVASRYRYAIDALRKQLSEVTP